MHPEKERHMEHWELSRAEQARRRMIVKETRQMLFTELEIETADEMSLMARYRGYYLQISFSELHPLMVLCLAKKLCEPGTPQKQLIANELNLKSILGSHALNDAIGCYSYRATQWLDAKPDIRRFFEILDRCAEEADRKFRRLTE